VGATISGYEQFRPIGSGGFSTVYEARQPELNRKVAVKVLTIGSGQDFDRAAFEGECRAMGTVSEHPNIVTVYESGFSQEGLPYITMELYNETLLDKIQASGFLSLEDVLVIGVQMAGALHRAHEERLLHRDIKPQNIFFSQYGEPFLGDFGIAALAHEQHVQKTFGLTFHYAAPEVLDGQMPTVSSDIYSLGATVYTALAGHRPFARPGQKEGEAAVTSSGSDSSRLPCALPPSGSTKTIQFRAFPAVRAREFRAQLRHPPAVKNTRSPHRPIRSTTTSPGRSRSIAHRNPSGPPPSSQNRQKTIVNGSASRHSRL